MINDESVNQEFNEDRAIRYYFTRGFSYHEILLFLEKKHRHVISYSTLLRRLNQLRLHRRQKMHIIPTLDVPIKEYRAVWHTLKMETNSGSSKVCRVVLERNRSDWMRASSKAWY